MPPKSTRRTRRAGGNDTSAPDAFQDLKSLYVRAIGTLTQSAADLLTAKMRLLDIPPNPALSSEAVKKRRGFLYGLLKIQIERVKFAHDNLSALYNSAFLILPTSPIHSSYRAAYANVRDTLKAISADPRICRLTSVSNALDELIIAADAIAGPAPVAGGRPRRHRGAGLCASRPVPAADPVAESQEILGKLNATRAALGLPSLQLPNDEDDAALLAELDEWTREEQLAAPPVAPSAAPFTTAGGAAPAPPRIRFVIERLDVNGDGIPDGDLVKEYQGDRLIAQKFVALDRLKQIADNAVAASPQPAAGRPQKIVYERAPAHPEDKPVVVQSDTSFGHYVKAGAALSLGDTAMDALVSGLAGLFSGEGGGRARRRRRS